MVPMHELPKRLKKEHGKFDGVIAAGGFGMVTRLKAGDKYFAMKTFKVKKKVMQQMTNDFNKAMKKRKDKNVVGKEQFLSDQYNKELKLYNENLELLEEKEAHYRSLDRDDPSFPAVSKSLMEYMSKVIHSIFYPPMEDYVNEYDMLVAMNDIPGTVICYDHFIDPSDQPRIVFEYAEWNLAGYLVDITRKGTSAVLSEFDLREMFKIVITTLYDMHSISFAHLDIKPQNILIKVLKDEDKDRASFVVARKSYTVIITDFGLAKEYEKNVLQAKIPGTRRYRAPWESGYDLEKADVWSLGITMFQVLAQAQFTKVRPRLEAGFHVGDQLRKFQTWMEKPFAKITWKFLSDGALSFVRRVLNKKQNLRPTFAQMLEDPWIRADEETFLVEGKTVPLNQHTLSRLMEMLEKTRDSVKQANQLAAEGKHKEAAKVIEATERSYDNESARLESQVLDNKALENLDIRLSL